MDKTLFIPISQNELKEINGGILIAIAAISITYGCWATSFIYNMGKDGKSGDSKNE
jgi:bacteriocin-like protein